MSSQEVAGFTARRVSHTSVSATDSASCSVEVANAVEVRDDATASTSGREVMIVVKKQDGTSLVSGLLQRDRFHFNNDHTAVLTLAQAPGAAEAFVTVLLRGEQAKPATDLRRILTEALAKSNWFDEKTDAGSSEMYFHYYGMLQHQQNMMQDATRTGTYFWAIMQNREDFAGKVVVDVGAGSGILSLFAAQAGAKKVYAVEASGMVKYARQLAAANGAAGAAIEVVHSKIEAVALPEKADVLISEPMGTLLLNERMLETYIYARKHLLKPGGKLFPSLGRIFVSTFQDAALHTELAQKAVFWLNPSFYGVSLTALHSAAVEGYYNKVVVDAFDPGLLTSTWAQHVIDFATADETDLHDVEVPLALVCKGPSVVHGIACWFDVLFPGSQQPAWLSTAPGMPATHWFQLRCVLQTPLTIVADGMVVTGRMRMVAHERQSYDVHVELSAPPLPGSTERQVSGGVFDLKEPYYRQLNAGWWQAGAAADGVAQDGS